jgi:hypothetical protein
VRRTVNRRGVTLAECVVALGLAAVLLGALHALLLAAMRAREREAAAREVRSALRVAAAVLRTELQSVSAAAGDLVAVDDSALTVRVVRGQGTVCAHPAADRLVLDAGGGSWLRSPDPARDVSRIYLDGDPDDAADDTWWVAAVSASGGGNCPDGRAGVSLTLAQGVPGAVPEGAPVRVLETVEYRCYRDASGLWWLGTRTRTASGWSATSPVAGPLRPGDGLAVRALDAGGIPAGPAGAAMLDIALRARSSRPAPRPDGTRASLEDSLRLTIAVVP